MTELAETLKQRNSVYGDFSDNAEVAQDLKDTLRKAWNGTFEETGVEIEAYVCESLELIATKLSRIVTGDPNYVDNWHDIAGYAKLVEDRLVAAKELDKFEAAPGIGDGFGALVATGRLKTAATLVTIDNKLLDDDDLVEIGRELVRRMPDGYRYANSPAEIVTELQNKVDELRAEVLERRNQLPISMQDSTVVLLKCDNGHTRLTATGLIDSGCPWCKVAELEVTLKLRGWKAMVDNQDGVTLK